MKSRVLDLLKGPPLMRRLKRGGLAHGEQKAKKNSHRIDKDLGDHDDLHLEEIEMLLNEEKKWFLRLCNVMATWEAGICHARDSLVETHKLMGDTLGKYKMRITMIIYCCYVVMCLCLNLMNSAVAGHAERVDLMMVRWLLVIGPVGVGS
ncbi:hypothetical protein Syun_031080 [Stephania yunnanensis]|uniref:Uncharacterized protein n=1 Tax=Stephania yunnanensis TaxID=152371 RepID=A0AAP0DZF0_9MAGN